MKKRGKLYKEQNRKGELCINRKREKEIKRGFFMSLVQHYC